jgi:hypothetical protein
MHGLINSSIQAFVTDCYGPGQWQAVLRRAETGVDRFEAMLIYDDQSAERLLQAAAAIIGKTRRDLLEDMGAYLIAHPRQTVARRLLRFSGTSYAEFLLGLDDLRDRVALAVPDLDLPGLAVRRKSGRSFDLRIDPGLPGYAFVLLGAVRAMADDYGALVFSDALETSGGAATLRVDLLDAAFSQARDFALGRGA